MTLLFWEPVMVQTPLMTITLRRAEPSDIAFIMGCERRPGYDDLVGRWPEAQHRETMAHPNWLYLLGAREGQAPGGFVLLRDMAEVEKNHGNLYLKRIAVHDAGAGFGRPFLAAAIDWVFANTPTHRFWLEVVEDNARAAHVYRSLGFVEEGRVREAFRHGTGRGSYIQMSLLKPEWMARA
jgi:RimJ/RimL family protein N-acetyltransferase